MNQTLALINEISAELQRLEADRPQQDAYCWVHIGASSTTKTFCFGNYSEDKARQRVRLYGGEAFPLYRRALP
jgi:hypothetical protein